MEAVGCEECKKIKKAQLARQSEERFLHFAASARFASQEKDWPLRSE
jgi:hypothetical protein